MRQAILHIAGERHDGVPQLCARCKSRIGRNWLPGAVIASYGHGDWSTLEETRDGYVAYSGKRMLAGEYRDCIAKGGKALRLNAELTTAIRETQS